MYKTLPIVLTLSLSACMSVNTPTTATSGPAILQAESCAGCHGKDLSGSASGPSLLGLDEHWQPSDLADFLADPDAATAKDARLLALDTKYSLDMPAFDALTGTQRSTLASWLLAR